VAEDELQPAAEELAATLAAGPTGAYGVAKRLLIEGATLDLADAMARESEGIAGISRTPDAVEAVAAFLEKRSPVFERP
jgi:2-(1,2-epoxy-1,2-dihydrophenyl)acetyl-CoA isomerase